ncbi:MAG: uracil phosphoribosyltransferase [Actinomycetota bacterium]
MGEARRVGGAVAGAHLARIRDAQTPSAAFRRATAALSTLVVAEAVSDVAASGGEVRTPLGVARTQRPARRITLVPVLRAGLVMLDPALSLLPEDTRVGFLGMARDEETLQPRTYVESIPPGIEDDDVVALDVMIATGGSSIAALDALVAAGARHLRVAAIIAAPEGLARLAHAHPEVPVTVAAVDECLNDRGFIVPGLGDAGDRLYGTA